MPRTQIRASQFRSKDIKEAQLAIGSVTGSTANINGTQGVLAYGTVSTPDLRQSAITPSKIASAPAPLLSAFGIITLDDTTDFFIVTGLEDIVKIIGWNAGRVTIQWQSDRTIIHSGGQLEMIGSVNRQVFTGDLNTFVFYGNGYAREISYIPKTPNAELAPRIVEVTATEGQTQFTLPNAPTSKDYVTLSVNGAIQNSAFFDVSGTTLTIASRLNAGDEVRIHVISKVTAAAISGTSVYDGGTF